MDVKTVGYAQFQPHFGAKSTNLEIVQRMVEEGKDADLIVFPELAISGYDFRNREELLRLAEPFRTGRTSRLILKLAAEYQVTIVIGYPESYEDNGIQLYNSCQLATPGGQLHNYRKIQLFSRESLIFLPGDAPPPVVETPAGKVGMMICFDWFFPEISRLLMLSGAQIIAHPSNLVLQYCQRAMFARSVENHLFTITCNRTGTENRTDRSLTFTGASQVLSPHGERPVSYTHLTLPTNREV